MKTLWAAANARFTTTFVKNPFGYKCDVCDRLWFQRSLKPTKEKHLPLLNNTFPEKPVTDFKLCASCKNSMDTYKVPTLSRSNGFVYPPKQHRLPALDPISARLLSPLLSFMQIRCLDAIDVPVDVETMVQQLPHQLDNDHAFNVNIKKNMIHKSTFLSGVVIKSVVKAELQFFLNHCIIRVQMMWFARGEFPFSVRSLRGFKASLVLSASGIRCRCFIFSVSLHPASGEKRSIVDQEVARAVRDGPHNNFKVQVEMHVW
ncbi:uncharacterized protein TNCV_2769141 [Trichonephila clavipes]|nr:uncharacterized protein TNCV_2769141 [Trichonephila clavipes]